MPIPASFIVSVVPRLIEAGGRDLEFNGLILTTNQTIAYPKLVETFTCAAAVEASLISPAALIVVSLSGICGFSLPNRDFAQAARLFRFGFAALGAFAGLFGVTAGFLAMLIHLAGLTSLDVPYLMPFSEGSASELLRRRAGREDP